MANEWISLLQGAPTNDLNMVRTAQESQAKAIENKKNAYDLYRTQKAQEIVGQSMRPDGTVDWDGVFKNGVKAGLGLDAFKQAQTMQTERRASELQQLQNRRFLESMGYDPTRWDSSAGPNVQVPAGNVPYEGPSQNNYDFITQPAETQIPQAQNPAFGANGVGESVQTPMAPSIQAPANAQDVVVQGNVGPASKTPMYELPTPAMRDPNAPSAVQEGYYNELWRQKGIPEGQDVLGGAGGANGVGGLQLSTAQMKPAEIDNLNRYLALRGIKVSGQEGLSALEKMAVSSVPVPVMNPMAMMAGKDEYAKEMGRYTNAVAEYPAKVQEARNKVSDAIKGGNLEILDKSIQVQRNERDKKDQDYALAGLGPEDNSNLWKKVSRAELEKINTMQSGYDDYTMAANNYEFNPSLGNLSALAVAKLKANGQPITMDAVESYIMASGAVPKEKELIFKKALKDLDVKSLLGAGGLNWLNLGFTGTPMDDTKIGMERKNLEWDIYRRGGLPYEGYMKPSGKSPSPGKVSPKATGEGNSKKGRTL